MNGPAPGTVIRLATWNVGILPVVVCPLCAAVVAHEGIEQHALVHAAALRGGDQEGPARGSQ